MIVLDQDEEGNLQKYQLLDSTEDQALYRIASKVCEQKMRSLGLDVRESQEVQQDMIYLRQRRKSTAETQRMIKRAVIGYIIPGVLILIVMGVGAWIKTQ